MARVWTAGTREFTVGPRQAPREATDAHTDRLRYRLGFWDESVVVFVRVVYLLLV